MAGVLAVLEIREKKLKKVSFEVLSEGKRIADALGVPLFGFMAGAGAKELANQASSYGAGKIFVVEDERLQNSYVAPYGRAIFHAAQSIGADAIILGATTKGKDLAAWVAGAFQTSVLSDCTSIKVDGGKIVAIRPIYAGKALSTVYANKKPVVLSVRPNVFSVAAQDSSVKTEVESIPLKCEDKDLLAVLKEFQVKSTGRPELTEAPIIVSGGRGIKAKENFHLIEELADVLGAAVGASRAIVDVGWRPHEDQVGQTGKTVSPNLYIACGISGAIQHLAGMSSSKVIVAINIDKDAPIFQIADYGIVGDLFEVVPRLTAEIKSLQK